MSVDGLVSRQFETGIGVVQADRAAGTLGRVLVVELGTNGTVTSSDFDAMMQAAAGVKRVVFVNVDVPRPWEAPDNAVLAAGVARYPGVAVLADWNAALHPATRSGSPPTRSTSSRPERQALAALIARTPERPGPRPRAPGARRPAVAVVCYASGHASIRTVRRSPVRHRSGRPVHGGHRPPYDVVGPEDRARLAARHSANAIRVELPEPDHRAGLDRYANAARQLEQWQEDGILRPRPGTRLLRLPDDRPRRARHQRRHRRAGHRRRQRGGDPPPRADPAQGQERPPRAAGGPPGPTCPPSGACR